MKSEKCKHFLPINILPHLFKDVVLAYPSERKNCDRDLKRILRNFEHRGMHTLIVELPKVDLLLLEVLASGAIPSSTLGDYTSLRSKRPVFLRGLWKLVLDNDGSLREDADPSAIYFIRQISSFFKKVDVEADPQKEERKIDEFRNVECDLAPFGNDWDTDSYRYNGDTIGICNYAGTFFQDDYDTICERTALLETCQSVADHLSVLVENEYCDSTNLGRVISGEKHGNGAVAEGSKHIDKYGMTHANLSLIKSSEFIYGNTERTTIMMDNLLPKELHSRLMAVPKDGRGPRLIAAEPTLNMWFQQSLLGFFANIIYSKTILSKFVDLKNQQLSKDMAKAGSVNQSLATIDLSSASDRLSCDLVHKFLRLAPKFRFALFTARTQTCRIQDDVVRLCKFATQGSAVTFPLQCYVFTIIALGATIHSNDNLKNLSIDCAIRLLASRKVIRVFGDDIIVPNHASGYAKQLLSLCGLKVNSEKSYDTGYFRESCGGDYYKGNDVTPAKMKLAYVKDKAIDVQALIDFSNNLYLKGCWNASSACLDAAYRIDNRSYYQPFVGVGIEGPGLVTSSGTSYHRLKMRYDSKYHRPVYRSWTTTTSYRGKSARSLGPWYKHAILEDGLSPSYSSLYGGRPVITAGLRWLTLQ